MRFGRNPRTEALIERALKQMERMLRDMHREGKDIAQLKLRKYQKTHYSNCTCARCLEARRRNNPHLRGILEDGFKVYVGEGDPQDE